MERVKDWDRYIAPLLFAFRDTPQASTHFSPFEIIYGRNVRGPMSILKEQWTNEDDDKEVKTTYQYVIDLREKIEETCKLAQKELRKVQERNQKYYNRKTKQKKLEVGDMALLLLPTDHNKLLLHWKGPFKVVGRVGAVDYRIELPSEKIKTFHANMLKKYYLRENAEHGVNCNSSVAAAVACVVNDDTEDEEEADGKEIKESGQMQLYNTVQKESVDDVIISSDLSKSQRSDVKKLLN